MFVEVECPDCGKKHYVDIRIEGIENHFFNYEGARTQFVLDHIEVKGVLPAAVVLEYL